MVSCICAFASILSASLPEIVKINCLDFNKRFYYKRVATGGVINNHLQTTENGPLLDIGHLQDSSNRPVLIAASGFITTHYRRCIKIYLFIFVGTRVCMFFSESEPVGKIIDTWNISCVCRFFRISATAVTTTLQLIRRLFLICSPT